MTNHETALPAVRRCARRLENQGVAIDDVADALFVEAAGRLAALTDMNDAVSDLALLWTAIGRAAQIKRGLNGHK